MRHAKPAESLIETMIAITVIVLATTAAMSVLRTSTDGNEIIGKKVVAMNLALEGFEALRNLRDTNYLLFSSDPDECWNALDVADVADCPTATKIADGETYFLTRDFEGTANPYFEWYLVPKTLPTQGYLSLFSVDTDGDAGWESQMYAYSSLTGVADMSAIAANQRLFQRTITIDYPSTEYYNATIVVSWYDNSVLRTLSLTRSIGHVY
ncbi:MAG: hypothetical protein AAB383_04970 [Patescibacteria group bacterium]